MQTFSLMYQQITPELFFVVTTIDNVETFSYLVTAFHSKLGWKKHVEYLTDRVVKQILVLKRLAGCLGAVHVLLSFLDIKSTSSQSLFTVANPLSRCLKNC